jgi:hypothetical protein
MSRHVHELWPADFGSPVETAPVTILREQAAALGQRTKNVVKAVVETVADYDEPGSLLHRFDLVVAGLPGYRYGLFSVRHGAKGYPLTVLGSPDADSVECKDEAAFLQALRAIFNAGETRRVILSLQAQGMTAAAEV